MSLTSRMFAVEGRQRIPVGRLLFLALFLLLLAHLAVGYAYAQEPKLPVLNTDAGHETVSVFVNVSGTAIDADLGSDCGSTVEGYRLKLTPNQAAKVASVDIRPYLCNDVALLRVPPGVVAFSVVSLEDAYSVAVPPLGAISGARRAKIKDPVLSDETFSAFVTVFPQKKGVDVPLIVKLDDGDEVSIESFTATWPVTQYRIQRTSTRPIFAEVWLGHDAFYGCWPSTCEEFGAVYTMVSSGKPDGGSFIFAGTAEVP